MLQLQECNQNYHWNGEFWLNGEGEAANTWRSLALGKVFLDNFFQGPHCDWPALCARWQSAGLELVSEASLQMLTGACLVRLQTHDDMQTVLLLCHCLRQLGRTQMALQAAESKLHLEHPDLLTCYATLLCDAGRWSEAHQAIERALQIKPSDASRQVRFRILAHGAATGRR